MDNQSLSHVRWKCQYHIVFIPKYRKKILYGKLKNDVREIISILCKYKDVQIIDETVCEDHIHLSVAIPPKISISSFMGYLKGKSTLMLYDRHPELQSKWDKSFWARGYYVSTIGNITEDAIKKYIVPTLTEQQIKFVYANEADVLNVALFGMTAKEWRKDNPELAKNGNIRDYTDLLHLIILNNLENTNAELIRMNIKQSDRLIRLNESARNQMEALKNNKNIKELEVLQQQVNEDNKYLIDSK